jgi:hypothetical protein
MPPAAAPPIRLRNLLPLAERVQAQLESVSHQQQLSETSPALLRLLDNVRRSADDVDAVCARAGTLPAGLPAPSRRAYQWLRYLSEPDNLLDAAAALGLARHVLHQAAWPRRPRLAGCQAGVAFYPTPYLFRMRAEQGTVHVTLAPGYLGAPAQVLEAVLRVALGYGRGAARTLMYSFAGGDDFAETTMALELATEPPPGSLRGQHYDLDDVFRRVNDAYFNGQVPRPRLAWSMGSTRRLLGYYQRSTDRLMISKSLDSPGVPACAIEMVMYHELLHKRLGVQLINGRHHAHTEAFRAAERQFAEYEKARAFLNSGKAA